MDDVVAALRAQQAELAGYVADLDAAGLLRPSRCPGWTVADVLLHLAQTNEMAVASVDGRLGSFVQEAAGGLAPVGSIDEWAGVLVDVQRSDPEADRDRGSASAEAQAEAFAGCDPAARVEWVAGQLAARTLATTRLTETWIHTVDVAAAFGSPPAPTARLWHTARLVWRTVPYALAQAGVASAGPVAFELVAPDGSTWSFGADEAPATVVTGSAAELCEVAGQRASAADTGLVAVGPDAEAVLRLVRTFA
jgi:uncharacterized protein (TIGR03084 family)